MGNFLDDTVNFGFGLCALSKEKIGKMVDVMVDKGQIAKENAESFTAELTKRGEEERAELKEMIDDRVKKAQDKYHESIKPMTREEVRALIREELEAYGKEKDNSDR